MIANKYLELFGKYMKKIGILMLKTYFPRLVGDIGNPETFEFPVKRVIVNNATSENVVKSNDCSLITDFIQEAKKMESEGIKAITTSCGFLSRFQKDIQAQLSIPFFSSSLLLLPFIQEIIGKKTIGILTARKQALDSDCFNCVNGEYHSVIYGMEGTHFSDIYVDNHTDLDVNQARNDIFAAIDKMQTENERIGAILFECTNMAPFSQDVRKKYGLPVFDICTLVNMLNGCV